ncbi:MAG TPA: TIGR01458 family HAD-type hydrolase [Acidobacteriota bacterium]|nr:TIGR01458 family HAD-type hydrolase [Acidobacteriota bacterium]
MTPALKNLSGLLIDLDGTVYVGDEPVAGAVEVIDFLRSRNIPFRLTTNTTTRSLSSLHGKLVSMGLPVEPHEIFSVIRAAVAYLRSKGKPSCYLLLTEDPRGDFADFPQSDEQPECVVVGDIGKYWDYELVNRVFRMVLQGADLVALHKGRYWQTESGLQVDIGAFVAGLEYVTGKEAVVIGKPSRSFFQLALEDLNLPAGQVAMVGDDIASDVGGAQQAGMHGILVRSGKYREELVAHSPVKPELTIDSIGDLVGLL